MLERVLKLEEIYRAKEVWITSSTQEIQPVTKIDGREINLKKSYQDCLWYELLSSYFSLA